MSRDAQQVRREDARVGALRFLAERDVLAHSPESVRRGVNREGADLSIEEIDAALTFLVGSKLVSEQTHRFGATKTYQVTPEGVLTHERGGL